MAVLSGILLTAAFPKIGLSALAWAAFVPLLWAVRNAGPREAFRRGMVFGIAHHLSLLYWLVPTMTIYGHLPLPLAIGILFLFAAVLSLVFTAPCIGALALAGPSPARLLVAFPVMWAASEFLRSFLFTGFPWGPWLFPVPAPPPDPDRGRAGSVRHFGPGRVGRRGPVPDRRRAGGMGLARSEKSPAAWPSAAARRRSP